MRFKIDENLPVEIATLLNRNGHDALTVVEQNLGGSSDSRIEQVCREEGRILVTFDLDFSVAMNPAGSPGRIVLRLSSRDKAYVLGILERLVPLVESERLENRLWIVEPGRVRIRQQGS